ncbi:hypothetical protein DL766_001268 [Monosporascus sp. MC13-8B]|uniref:60S ribosomal protein L35 n=1 Tax=Monosporascus cannonballus TaxID=155416 RepID=A0ABY0GY81_9PEZI|nr:hypothetical protein DL762_007792 [Monosporascus cannonballus]RYO98900.1 hypothetical protein DL763_001943 [Monosporascus cannonballus]RYP37780.1 hypothetical protein DL766_001268 [Monosporascus sp. MC13-8B]
MADNDAQANKRVDQDASDAPTTPDYPTAGATGTTKDAATALATARPIFRFQMPPMPPKTPADKIFRPCTPVDKMFRPSTPVAPKSPKPMHFTTRIGERFDHLQTPSPDPSRYTRIGNSIKKVNAQPKRKSTSRIPVSEDESNTGIGISSRSSPKVKTGALWNKSKEDLLKTLGELKAELSQLRIQKVTSSGTKLNRIHDLRKSIARVLTVVNLKQRSQLRLFYKNKKYLPLDLRPKQTRAIRRRLSPEEKSKVLEKTKKRQTHFPQRKYAVKAA